MKRMLTLAKLIEEVENDGLNPDYTLVDADSISLLEDEYLPDQDQSDLEEEDGE